LESFEERKEWYATGRSSEETFEPRISDQLDGERATAGGQSPLEEPTPERI
jgi:hypothetical protein